MKSQKIYKLLKILIFILGSLILLLSLYRGVRLYLGLQPKASFPLNIKWQVDLGSSTYDYPVYQAGLVLFPAENIFNSHWYGLDAVTGHIVWSQTTGSYNFLRCISTEHMVISGPWSLIVLETQTGEIAWEGERGWVATCSEETVFTGGPRLSILAFDIQTGQQRWVGTNPQKPFNGLIYNPGAGEIIAEEGTLSQTLHTIDAGSGALHQSFTRIATPPNNGSWARGSMYFIDQGQLFIGATVLDARTGQIIHKEDRYYSITPPTVTADTVYISDPLAGVVALDRTTFDIKWIYQPLRKQQWLPLFTFSPVAILDKVGYVIFSDATLRAIDLETGQELGYWQPGWIDLWDWPVCTIFSIFDCTKSARVGLTTSADTLFVSFGDGKLYAFGR